MDAELRLTGACGVCATSLERALLRVVRHYQETELVEITCVGCESVFLAVVCDAPTSDAFDVNDVADAAVRLSAAQRLSDLFADLPNAA